MSAVLRASDEADEEEVGGLGGRTRFLSSSILPFILFMKKGNDQLKSRSRPAARLDGARAAMRTTVHLGRRANFHPGPTRRTTFFADPLRALEHARDRQDLEVPFRLRHSSGAGMPGDFRRLGCTFAVRAVGPGAGQVPMLVTMFGASLHHCVRNATADVRFGGNVVTVPVNL